MESKKLKIRDVLELEVQLAGFTNDSVSVKGLLREKLNIKTKYWLGKVFEQISKEKKLFNELRDELIKKYGEEYENGIEVKQFKDNKLNDNFIKFSEELNALLDQEIEMKFPKLSIDDFDFSSEDNYSFTISFVIE